MCGERPDSELACPSPPASTVASSCAGGDGSCAKAGIRQVKQWFSSVLHGPDGIVSKRAQSPATIVDVAAGRLRSGLADGACFRADSQADWERAIDGTLAEPQTGGRHPCFGDAGRQAIDRDKIQALCRGGTGSAHENMSDLTTRDSPRRRQTVPLTRV